MPLVRVRPDVRAVVFVTATQSHITLVPDQRFPADDHAVKEHPWAFQRDAEVEQASAAPGEKRAR
jgi:hypothetical protein